MTYQHKGMVISSVVTLGVAAALYLAMAFADPVANIPVGYAILKKVDRREYVYVDAGGTVCGEIYRTHASARRAARRHYETRLSLPGSNWNVIEHIPAPTQEFLADTPEVINNDK